MIRNQLQEALAREQTLSVRLAAVVEKMADGFMAVDREWRITYINAAAERDNGVTRAQVLGKTHWEAFPHILGTELEPKLRRAMAERVTLRHEFFYKPYQRWYEINIHPVDDGGLAFYGRDLSDRKRTEQALRVSEERFRHYFELGLIGMAISSPTKGWVEVNEEFCRILGYTRDELTKMTWDEMTHPEDLPADVAQFERVLSGEIDGYTLEKRFIRKDKRPMATAISVKCLRREDRSVDYFVALLQDVTQRDALLASEREARALAEQSNRMKDEFLGTLSHELRTPIGNALMWLHVLRVSGFDESLTRSAFEAIESSVRQQARLINDLLDLTGIAAGKLRIQVAPVDLSQVLEAAITAMLPSANDKSVGIRHRRHSGSAMVSGDAVRLQQVFSNLIGNAVKFTPEGGEVNVQVQRAGAALEVLVRDTGEGIDGGLLPHVFERFSQADSSMTRAHGGLGLGLAIVKHLVELHGGRVRAESEGKGRGATFIVSLPAPDAPAAASRPESTPYK